MEPPATAAEGNEDWVMDQGAGMPGVAGWVDESDVPRHEAQRLDGLMRLVQALAGASNDHGAARALFDGLKPVIDADVIALARSNPAQVWMRAASLSQERKEALRSRLLDRLEATSSRARSSRTVLHLVRARAGPEQLQPGEAEGGSDPRWVIAHKIPLKVAPSSAMLLYVERAPGLAFSEQERRLIEAVAALLSLALSNCTARRQMEEAVLRDPLTGVFDRRALDGLLHRELTARFRYGMHACLLLLDLDHFKVVNERLGYPSGDSLLKNVARLLEETVREVDSVVRYGGESFAVVLPHTDLEQAQALAERIRVEIERRAFECLNGQVRITASLGVASARSAAIESVDQWITAADAALCEAKARGRNLVATHTSPPSAPARVALSLAA